MSINNLQYQQILGSDKPVGMLLVLEVRKRSGKKAADMARALDMSRQNYHRLETKGQLLSLPDYFTLERIFIDSGCGSAEEFHTLARRLAKKEKSIKN